EHWTMPMIANTQEQTKLTVEFFEWTEWRQLASTWSDLVTRCQEATFFVTTDWVETWLDEFGSTLRPTFVVFRTDDDTPIGACILVRRLVRKGPFAIRRIYLNTSGEDDADSPCIEFNTILCETGQEAAVARELLRAGDQLGAA